MNFNEQTEFRKDRPEGKRNEKISRESGLKLKNKRTHESMDSRVFLYSRMLILCTRAFEEGIFQKFNVPVPIKNSNSNILFSLARRELADKGEL